MATFRPLFVRWHDRCTHDATVLRLLLLLPVAAFLAAPTEAGAQAESGDTPTRGTLEDRMGGAGEGRGWRALTGLRLEQWIAPVDDHLRFDVRLTLPEMAFGERFSVETFKWERLDVAEGRSERGENGTVYHLLGARYRRDTDMVGFFVGAHAFTWSGHGRPVTPWLGLRVGDVDVLAVSAEARLLGLGPLGGELMSPLDDADITVAVDGPPLGRCRIGLRGRLRDVRHPDRHQHEQMASLGVELGWGKRRVFVGFGIQHQSRSPIAPADAAVPMPDRMDVAAAERTEGTAVMLHLDAETPLPRSLGLR
jgi:hypothetical protein